MENSRQEIHLAGTDPAAEAGGESELAPPPAFGGTEAVRALANDLGHGRTAAEIVADALTRLIATGAISAGERLPPERELAAGLGTSRATVRSALHKLAGDGLVEVKRGRSGGAIVLDKGEPTNLASDKVSPDSFAAAIDQSFEFRLLIEPGAAALAAARATTGERSTVTTLIKQRATTLSMWHALDSSFHLMIAQATQNADIVVAVERQRSSFFVWANSVFLPNLELVVRPTFGAEHAAIAEAIAEGDSELARLEMVAHLERAQAQFADALARGTKLTPSRGKK